jgi:sulfur carrier protein ThiS adenylyltransferase
MLRVNEKQVDYRQGITVGDLVAELKPEADLYIVNGYPAPIQTVLADGDVCCLIKRGETPTAEEMQWLLAARHSPGVHEKVRQATVGIMGLGGLGSPVAVALARIGVGRLVLADFDFVEPSNLNRQQYFIEQIGMKKTEALGDNILRINPYVKVELIDDRLTEDTIPVLFQHVDVLAECFDDPVMKAGALRAARMRLPSIPYVGASGLAGYDDNNLIKTREVFPHVFLAGDEASAAGSGHGLMAPRVGIVAHHQANQILRIIMGAG